MGIGTQEWNTCGINKLFDKEKYCASYILSISLSVQNQSKLQLD